MDGGRIKLVVSSLLIAGAGIFLYGFLHHTPPLPQPKAHEGVGLALAEQAAKLAGGGKRVVAIVRDTSVFPNPATQLEMKGFTEGLKQAGLAVAVTNSVKLSPLYLVAVPQGEFVKMLGKRQGDEVFVSFLGPPVLSPAQVAQLGETKPKIVAFCPGEIPRQVDLRTMFEQGLLQAAIISRPDPPLVPPQTGGPPAWFRHYYQVITAANLSDLPLTTGVRETGGGAL